MATYLVLLVVLAAVAFVVAGPLRRARTGAAPGEDERSAELRELEAAREAKYREIRDAELDHQTGKLSDADFEAIDRTLRAEALGLLRGLDAARATIARDGDDPRDPAGVPRRDADLPGADALG